MGNTELLSTEAVTEPRSSKKSLLTEVLALSSRGLYSSNLLSAGLQGLQDVRMESGELQSYASEIVGSEKRNRDHRALTQLAVEKNYVAPASADGCYTLLPKGAALCSDLEMIGERYVRDVVPSVHLKVPPFFSTSTSPLQSLTSRFGESAFNRMIPIALAELKSQAYLRYAGDADVFAYLSEKTFSKMGLPIGFFSHGDTARNDHELQGLIRTLSFFQPCHHLICERKDGLTQFEAVGTAIASMLRAAFLREDWFVSIDVDAAFFEDNRRTIADIAARNELNCLVRIYSEPPHYYRLQFQYMFGLSTGHFIQLSNLQLDEQNGAAYQAKGGGFDIRCGDGSEDASVAIVHSVIPGRNTSALAVILDDCLRHRQDGHNFQLPFFASSYQLRVVPAEPAASVWALEKLVPALSQAGVRYHVDDRDAPFRRKIKTAHQDWANYLLVIGEREMSGEAALIAKSRDGQQLEFRGEPERFADYLLAASVGSAKHDFCSLGKPPGPFADFDRYSTIPDFLR